MTIKPRWVTHTRRKVPMTPGGQPAKVNDPATWSGFAAVRRLTRRGFVLNGDGVIVLDLDHCLADGVLAPWAAALLAACPSTYVEVSPSGTGLHVFGRGSVVTGRKIRDGRDIELYGTGRYVAVTGRKYGRCPSRLADLSGVLAAL